MYLNARIAFIRNLSVALLNGAVTLVILLIAPMGLAGVITNTILVMLGSFGNATLADTIVRFLQNSPTRQQTATLDTPNDNRPLPRQSEHDRF
ncbi:MAG: hypothetical protein J7642_05315 [Cyanobacteria bacterium SBC]|nr:hypothetical protein [Cyanobacteria bacterium SBC]